MIALIGPALVIAGFALYMASNNLLARFRRVPWEFLAVSAAGVIVSIWLSLREGGVANAFGMLVSGGSFAFLWWFFFRFSMYGAREDRPVVGDRFPDFRLPASDGTLFDFATARGKRHLLIFYRGSW
jgi:hypothetical protein